MTGTRRLDSRGQAGHDASVSRPELWRWVAGVALVTVSVLVVVLLAGGGAPQPVPAGLPDSGPVTGWGLPLVRLLGRPARPRDGRAAAGCRAAAALTGADARRHAPPARRRWPAGRPRRGSLAVAVEVGADRLGHPRPAARRRRRRRRCCAASSGRPRRAVALLIQVALLVVVAGLARSPRTDPRRGARAGGGAGRAGAAGADRALGIVRQPRARGREPAGAPARGGAVGRRAGGARAGRQPWPAPTACGYAVPRFSTLAAWCFAAVAVSGVVNAGVRLAG